MSVYLFFYGKNTLLVVNFVLKYVHVHTYTWRRESMKQTKWKKYIVYIAFSLFIIVFIPTIVVNFSKENGVHKESYITEETENTEEGEPSFFVQVEREATGEIEKVPIEEYVISVVAAEMPADFNLEALKAQAVAARTYVVQQMIQQGEDIVMTDTTAHQVYKNREELKEHFGGSYEEKMKKIEQAAMATAGEVITYNNEPITPTFFSMSNGYTEAAKNYWGNDLPYLQVVESKWEESLPNFTEQKVFTLEEMNNALQLNHNGGEVPIYVKRTESNRVETLKIGEVAFSGKEIREKLQLRSNDFSVKQKGDHFIFTTKGYGHGVGMSQYGANFMAEEGKNYQDILAYYYKDVHIEALQDTAPSLVSN